eukprot:SAG31_NODE_282_length_18516_cov_9.338600_9_plen_58_part_00
MARQAWRWTAAAAKGSVVGGYGDDGCYLSQEMSHVRAMACDGAMGSGDLLHAAALLG